jgi:hypothetical protein
LSVIYRDAFAVLDALGWPPDAAATTVDVPLTAGHVEQLRRRRRDLGYTNLDRLETRGEQTCTDAVTTKAPCRRRSRARRRGR